MKQCEITGKSKQFGNNVSFSQRKTRRTWDVNIQKKTVVIDGKKVKLKIATSTLRTLRKKGVIA